MLTLVHWLWAIPAATVCLMVFDCIRYMRSARFREQDIAARAFERARQRENHHQ